MQKRKTFSKSSVGNFSKRLIFLLDLIFLNDRFLGALTTGSGGADTIETAFEVHNLSGLPRGLFWLKVSSCCATCANGSANSPTLFALRLPACDYHVCSFQGSWLALDPWELQRWKEFLECRKLDETSRYLPLQYSICQPRATSQPRS